MAIVTRRRTLRPSTRQPDSRYRVKTHNLGLNDTLIIEIDHEGNPDVNIAVFECSGVEVGSRNSIHFTAEHTPDGWIYHWTGVQPTRTL